MWAIKVEGLQHLKDSGFVYVNKFVPLKLGINLIYTDDPKQAINFKYLFQAHIIADIIEALGGYPPKCLVLEKFPI